MKNIKLILVIAVVICFCACCNKAKQTNIYDSQTTTISQVETSTEENVDVYDTTNNNIAFADNTEKIIIYHETADTILKNIFEHECGGTILGFPKEYKKQVEWYNKRKNKTVKFFNNRYPNKKNYTAQQKFDIVFSSVQLAIDNGTLNVPPDVCLSHPLRKYLLCFDIVNLEMNIVDNYNSLFASEVAYFENLYKCICDFISIEYGYAFYGGSIVSSGPSAESIDVREIRLNDMKRVYDAYENNDSIHIDASSVENARNRFQQLLNNREKKVIQWIKDVKNKHDYFTTKDMQKALSEAKTKKKRVEESFNEWLDKRITYMDNCPKISDATIRTINELYEQLKAI